jgi:hypothetical protein
MSEGCEKEELARFRTMKSDLESRMHRFPPRWSPNADSIKMLDFAMAKIKSVPYKVSSRWVFYRLVQAGFISKTQEARFDYLLSRARKRFYGEWKPDTLTDSIRQAYFKGEAQFSFSFKLDSIAEQDYYVQLWFEAEAMHQQFEHHTRNFRVSLVPFRGDCSIPFKWRIAKKLETIQSKYLKPVRILYFGDCDRKGLQIVDAAMRDIRAWCSVDFGFERVGLTLEQAKAFGLPENPNKPGNYQWEALEDEHARKLILGSLLKYQKPVSRTLEEREKSIQNRVREKIHEVLNAESGVIP